MASNRTRREKERQDRVRRIVLWGLGIPVFCYVIASLAFGDLGLGRYFALKGEYRQIQDEIQSLERENTRLRQDVESLKTDPQMIEKLARERLGLVREGEIVYQFPDR